MTDKGKGLSALFGESMRDGGRDERTGERFALMMVEDEDGDIAIVKVDRSGDDSEPIVLGWMKDKESAEELASIIVSIANGSAMCL